MELHSGIQIGEFVLERRLGMGCLGEVWLAYQETMQRHTALKMLSYELLSDNSLIERFMHEAKMLGKLQHPNIVTVFEVGKDKGFYYLANRYIDGINFDEKLKAEKTFKEKYALTVIATVAEALKYAWDNFKMTHRDVKPANIMEDAGGTLCLMDLGISKDFEDNPYISKSSIVIGTPYYMSPEQARSEDNINFKADIYSLGATLFHFVTGQFPFDANSPIGILTKHITDPLPNPQKIKPSISPACSALIKWMMEKSTEKRPETLDALIEAIRRVQDGLLPKQKKIAPDSKPKSKTKTKTKSKSKPEQEPELPTPKYVVRDKEKEAAELKKIRQIPMANAETCPTRFIGQVIEKKKLPPNQIPLKKKTYEKEFSEIID